MKTTGFLFCILFCCAAFSSGCSQDRYSTEKDFWYAQKQAQKIFNNPNASPPQELERVVGYSQRFVNKHPDNILASRVEFDIARLYIVKEQYEKGRAQLESLIKKYKNVDNVCAEAVFVVGNSYELQDKWDMALEQYKKIINQYPTTIRGLSVPVYIAQHYRIKHQPEQMIAAFHDAIVHYKALVEKYPDTPFAFKTDTLIAECYAALGDWQNTVATLNTIVNKYKDKTRLDGILMNISMIYYKELKDNAMAAQTLQRLIKEYPKSRLVKPAKEYLKKIEKK